MSRARLELQLSELHPACYGWALGCCNGNLSEAEDVLQTAYVKVLDGRARFEGASTFKTWLFAVIRRTAAERRRRTWVRALALDRWFAARSPDRAQPDPDRPPPARKGRHGCAPPWLRCPAASASWCTSSSTRT